MNNRNFYYFYSYKRQKIKYTEHETNYIRIFKGK
jgi:hypothetical protein